ncbi:MAG: class I SAM-dependent methyltransferase [Chloroflexota bacterium]
MTSEHIPFSPTDQAYFDEFPSGYSPYTPSDLDLILSDLLQTVEHQPVNWVCEVGSADGQFSSELARHLPEQVHFLGLDIAERLLKRYPFHRIHANAFQIPLKKDALQAICFTAALHHLTPFSAALDEMERVLAPGGIVYFLEPNYYHPYRRFFMQFRWLYKFYRAANDVPVNPRKLQAELTNRGYQKLAFGYINIHFKSPGFLQSLQNALAALKWPDNLLPYVMPWFILIAQK